MQDRNTVYISEKKDADIWLLLNDIGANQFRKLVRICFECLTDPSKVGKAKDIASDHSHVGDGTIDVSGDGWVQLKVGIGRNENAKLIKQNASMSFSMLSKIVIRNVLGLNFMSKYLFKNGASPIPIVLDASSNIVCVGDTSRRHSRPRKKKSSTEQKNATSVNTSQTVAACPVPTPTPVPVPVPVEQAIAEPEPNSDEEAAMDLLSMLEMMM